MMKGLTIASFVIAILGALNWMLVGIFNWNFVSWIFGSTTSFGSRVVYIVMGLAGLWLLNYLIRIIRKVETPATSATR